MSPPGADGNRFSWIQKIRTKFYVPLRRLATTHSSQGRGTEPVLSSEEDIEKGPLDNYEPLDLRYCLALSNEANKAAEIQPKHVGVTWEDLQVVAHGDNGHKVNSFS